MQDSELCILLGGGEVMGIDGIENLKPEPIGKVKVEEDEQGLKMTFFDQLREVQAIVDEANKKVDE